GDQNLVENLSSMCENRRNTLMAKLHEIGWEVKWPTSTFFAWLPVPKGYTSEELVDLLLYNANVVVAPGNEFGLSGEGYVRVGLLDSEERLEEAAERIGALNIF